MFIFNCTVIVNCCIMAAAGLSVYLLALPSLQLFRIARDLSCRKRFMILGKFLRRQSVRYRSIHCDFQIKTAILKTSRSCNKVNVGRNVLIPFHPPIHVFLLDLEALLLVFSVTPFKIDQNKIKTVSIDNVQNEVNIYQVPRQDSGQKNIPYTRYTKKCFTQIYRDLYGNAMLVPTWMGTNMADGKQQKHL